MAHRVVVGVDGSPGAGAALAWAAEEARLRGAELVACTVLDQSESRNAADPAGARTPDSPLVESAGAYPVTAAGVLVGHSADADLLVLGSRAHNPVAGVLLGSTTEHCARHAHCPVMIIHAAGDQRSGGGLRLSCTAR
ncbi:MAG TPA: universal stress protein [Streptosporangiaceae bacterium]|jgi:nucleotide-binding universal stress UspA family protein